MEEEFKNANILLYKYRFFVITLVILITYYLTKEQKPMNQFIICSVVAVLTWILIEAYASYEAKNQERLLTNYSQYISGEDNDPQMEQQNNSQIDGFKQEEIEQIKISQLARAADQEIMANPIGQYVKASVSVMESSPYNNQDINVLKGEPGLYQNVYLQGPVTVSAENMVRAASNQNATQLRYNLF